MPRPLVVSLIQSLADDGDVRGNQRRMLELIETAAQRGSQLCVLPEVWTGTGLSAPKAHEQIAEAIPGPTTEMLCEAAARHRMVIVGSMYERDGDTFYNTAPVIGADGRILGAYRKTHLFDVPNRKDIQVGLCESDKVTPGSELQVYDMGSYKLGVAICSDLRFPEIFRTLAKAGADVVAVPTAFLSPRLDHWELLVRTRALDNQFFLVATGMVGREPISNIGFVGRAMVADPWGVPVATASDVEGCTTTYLDLDLRGQAGKWWPLTEQLQPKLYEGAKVIRG